MWNKDDEDFVFEYLSEKRGEKFQKEVEAGCAFRSFGKKDLGQGEYVFI